NPKRQHEDTDQHVTQPGRIGYMPYCTDDPIPGKMPGHNWNKVCCKKRQPKSRKRHINHEWLHQRDPERSWSQAPRTHQDHKDGMERAIMECAIPSRNEHLPCFSRLI